MCDIVCPKKNNCTSHPHKCTSCTRNTGKRDYYKPEPYIPWWPYTYPYTYPYITWQITYNDHYDYGNDGYTTNSYTTLTWT